jgi:hypothetical protein
MALASLTQPPRADRASACELLGPDAPLARVLARLVETFDQLAVSAVIVCGAALWLALGGRWGTEVVVGAALTLSGLGGRLAILIAERNDRVLELIIRGDGDLPLEAVDRSRRRLLDRKARQRLARTIAAIRDASTRPPWVGTTPVDARVIDAVERELSRVISLLDAERAGIRGAARAYRLLAGPASPLYGDDAHVLREELNQIGFLLDAGV